MNSYSYVVEFDQLYNISKFYQILFLVRLLPWVKNPGMEPFGMTLLTTFSPIKFFVHITELELPQFPYQGFLPIIISKPLNEI